MDDQLSSAQGIAVNKYFGGFFLSPYTESDIGNEDHIPGFDIGVYCGIYLLVK
jgi:hypothetical protein